MTRMSCQDGKFHGDDNVFSEVERKTLEMLRFAICKELSIEIYNNSQILVQVGSMMGRDLQMRLQCHLPAEEIISYKIESSGWELFKSRWFPDWMLKKFPVKYETFKAYMLHPDIKVPENQDRVYYAMLKDFGLNRFEVK